MKRLSNTKNTKGLWGGAWKNSNNTELNIQCINKNVETFRVYSGNNNLGVATFKELEDILTLKLWYIECFYPIPPPPPPPPPPPAPMTKQKAIFVNYHHKTVNKRKYTNYVRGRWYKTNKQ